MNKIIITTALVGSVPTKDMNPNLPISPEELADDALKCYESGASVVHIHARNQEGENVHDFETFKEIYDAVKAKAPELIIQLSTGGRAGSTFESRSQCLKLNPEMASMNTGSVNFPDSVYINTPETIRKIALMMQERNIKPEVEIFDTSFIQPALDLHEEGVFKDPLYFNFVFGLKGSQPPTFTQLSHLLNLIPQGLPWNISGIGRYQLWTTYLGIALGGNIRVGLEDNIYYKRGVLASNVDLVKRAVRLSEEFGRSIANPDEARSILGLN